MTTNFNQLLKLEIACHSDLPQAERNLINIPGNNLNYTVGKVEAVSK